jgi:hypothetical protein
MIRPEMPTSLPKYYSGLGWAVHPKEAAEMSYAVTDGSYGANGASGGIVWIDPSLQLIRIYLTHHLAEKDLALNCFLRVCVARREHGVVVAPFPREASRIVAFQPWQIPLRALWASLE